jgi:hypothetical protein
MEPVSHYQIETEYSNAIPNMVNRTNDKISTLTPALSEDGKISQVGVETLDPRSSLKLRFFGRSVTHKVSS